MTPSESNYGDTATVVKVPRVGIASNPQSLSIISQVPLPTPLHNWVCTASVAINSHLDVNMSVADVRKARGFDRRHSGDFSFFTTEIALKIKSKLEIDQ